MFDSYGRPVFTTFDSGTYLNRANVADGATAIAHKFGNANTLSTSGAKIVSWFSDNFTTEKAYINKDGLIQSDGGMWTGGYLYTESGGVYTGSVDSYHTNRIIQRVGNEKYLIGNQAGDNTASSKVIGIGYLAVKEADASAEMIGIGTYSLIYTKGFSVGIGNRAGGTYNSNGNMCSVGYYSGYHGNIPVEEVASFGLQSSFYSGSFTSSFGNRAGYYAGANQVNIGYKAGYGNQRSHELCIHNDEAIGLITGNFDLRDARINGDLHVFNQESLGSEVLSETDFSTHANWTPSNGDWVDSGGNAVYTHSTGASTLTQASGNFASAAVGDRWYIFQYTISGTDCLGGATPNVKEVTAEITTGFCDVATPLNIYSNGTHYTLLKSKSSPGDFVISCTSVSVGTFTIDDVSLKEIQGGDLWIRDDLNALGQAGIGTDSPAAQLHVDQGTSDAAIPVLTVDQADVSEEFIKFIGESTTDASQSLVDAADMTTPGSIVGWLKIYVEDVQSTNPITDGAYFVPFYSAPSA